MRAWIRMGLHASCALPPSLTQPTLQMRSNTNATTTARTQTLPSPVPEETTAHDDDDNEEEEDGDEPSAAAAAASAAATAVVEGAVGYGAYVQASFDGRFVYVDSKTCMCIVVSDSPPFTVARTNRPHQNNSHIHIHPTPNNQP